MPGARTFPPRLPILAIAAALAFAVAPAASRGSTSGGFALCGGGEQANCVIDGDTIDYQGQRIRMIDFDAPEIATPKCANEEALGQKAKLRLLELLNAGTVRIVKSGKRDTDRYGRNLRLVTVNGRSAGDILIEEGLAWPWEGRRHDWCRN